MIARHVYHQHWFTALGLGLLTILALFSTSAPQVRADSTYIIPDTLGDYVNYAMTVNNGNPVLSYYSTTINQTVIAFCGNPSCETGLTVIRPVDTTRLVDVAITIVDGNPLIAYSTNLHLRVVACIDPLCLQQPIMTNLDDGFFIKVAMTLQNGKPLIAYEVGGGTNYDYLKLAFCTTVACSASTKKALNMTNGVIAGNNYEMGIGLLSGNPIIAYTKGNPINSRVVNLLKCLSPTCVETPIESIVDTAGINPSGISLIVIANKPIITYAVPETPYVYLLKVATCTDPVCNDPLYVHTIDHSLWQTSVNVINGLPVIAYVKNDGIRIAKCLDLDCNYLSSTLIEDATHNFPKINGSYNSPVVSYMKNDQSTYSSVIKVYYGGDFQPLRTSTPTPSYTAIPTSSTGVPTSSLPTSTLTATWTPSITPTLTITPTVTLTPPANAAPKRNYYTIRTPTLTWNRVNWATGYLIQISTDVNFAAALTFTGYVPAESSAYITGSLANGTYYWRVKAMGSSNNVFTLSNIDSFVISVPP